MSTRDMYDKSILKALQSIAKSLDRLANVAEGKSDSEVLYVYLYMNHGILTVLTIWHLS